MVNIAVVGTGAWGKNLVRTISKLSDSNLHTCCDMDDKQLNLVRKHYPETKVTKDINDIFNNPEIEAVIVASSVVTHFEIAKKALLSGKHVYVEKPLALNVKDAQSLIDLSRKKNKKLMVGHLLLYHPAVRKLKEIIDSGELGEIYYIYSQRVNLGKIRKEENALWSFAPHDISIILYFLDEEPVVVSCHGEAYLQNNIEDVVFVHMQFKNKRMAHIQLSWLDPHKIRRTTIVGSKKMAVFDDTERSEKIKIYDKGANIPQGEYLSYEESITLRNGEVYIPEINMKEPLVMECQHFLDCIKDNKGPITDGENGLKVVRILESAQKSLKNKGIPVMS